MSDGELPLTPAEKRAAAARAKAESVGHPLFPTEPGERAVPIAFIQLRRYTENGPVDHQRIWPSAEIQGPDDIFAMFGGGTYEIWGRSALPNGQPGGIAKRIRLSLEGAPRPFASGPQGATGVAVAAGSGAPAQPTDRFELMMHMMRDDRREARERLDRQEAESRAAEERRQLRDEQRTQQTTQLMVAALQTAASLVSAMLNRPAPAPPPPGPDLMPLLVALIPKPDTSDPLDRLGKVIEIADKVNPKKTTGESIPEMLAGFGHAMHGMAELEQTRIDAASKGLVPAHLAVPLPGGTEGPPAAATGNGNAPPPPAPPPLPELEGDDPARLVS